MDKNRENSQSTIRLIYIIGTYPGLTNTFIDSEIKSLRQMGDFDIQLVSLRNPANQTAFSAWQQAMCQATLYLIPTKWIYFNFAQFFMANFFFMFTRPGDYFGTLAFLVTRPHPNVKAWLKTLLHFGEGVYTAYLIHDREFDVLHAHFIDRAAIVALVCSRFLHKPYSIAAHAFDIFANAALLPEKIAGARFLVSDSQYNIDFLHRIYPDLDLGKMHAHHPWVDLTYFSPPVSRPEHAKLQILSTGRLVEKKGHTDLIEACRLLRLQNVDLECRIIGEGPLRSELEYQITQNGLQECVFLLGAQPQTQVLELLSGWADVFALPCVIAANGDRDGIPVSLAEAMAMEVPVVSTNIIGIGELVQPGTGILVRPKDTARLAEALKFIYASGPASRLKMGRLGRAVIDNEFNLHKCIGQLAGYFRNIVAEENGHTR